MKIVALTMALLISNPSPPVPGALNPDVTQGNIGGTICTPGWSTSVRPSLSFTNPLKHSLLPPKANMHAYELDHRVPLELGGCPTCKSNLWLQPWRDPVGHKCEPAEMMDAACKDELENLIHREVCAGEMTLKEGRAVFLGDWIAAYHHWMQDGHHH